MLNGSGCGCESMYRLVFLPQESTAKEKHRKAMKSTMQGGTNIAHSTNSTHISPTKQQNPKNTLLP
jgi:hypothetical protein